MADDKKKNLESTVNSEVHLMGMMYSQLDENGILQAQVQTPQGRKMGNNLGQPMSYEEALKLYYNGKVKSLEGNSLSAKLGTLNYDSLKEAYNGAQKNAKFSDIVALANYVGLDTSSYTSLIQEYGDKNYGELTKELATAAKEKTPEGTRADLILKKMNDLYKDMLGKAMDKLTSVGKKEDSTYTDTMIKASDPKDEHYPAYLRIFKNRQKIEAAQQAAQEIQKDYAELGLKRKIV